MSDNITEVLGQIQNAVTELRGTDIANLKSADALNVEKMDRINADINAMKATVESLEQKAARPSMDAQADANEAEWKSDWVSWARKGAGEHDVQQKAITITGTDAPGLAAGGLLMPRTMEAGIYKQLEVLSPIRAEATVISVSSNDYRFLQSNGDFESGWVGETDNRPETSTNTLMEVRVPMGEVYAFPFASQWALDDSAYPLDSLIEEETALSFAKRENAAFLNGDGVNKPMGICATTGIATVKSGVAFNGTSGTGLPTSGDAYIQMVYALAAPYRQGAKFLMPSSGQGSVRTLKDGNGAYVWSNSLIAGQPDTLAGYDIVTVEELPGVAANALPVVFGNVKRGYLIADRINITTIRDPLTKKGFVGFYSRKRVGGMVKDKAAFVALKIGA